MQSNLPFSSHYKISNRNEKLLLFFGLHLREMVKMQFSVIRASRTLMNEVIEIINSNFDLYKDIIINPADISEHKVDESWVEKNFNRREFYLGRENGQYIGMISYQNLGKFAYIGYFFVKRGYHQKGVGKQLLRFIEMRTMQDNLTDLRLFSNKGAEWAQKFYEKSGFSIITSNKEEILTLDDGIMETFYEENHIYWKKILPPPKPLVFS